MTPAARVAVTGTPYFARVLNAALREEGWRTHWVRAPGWRLDRLLRAFLPIATADLVFLVGGQVERWSQPWLTRRLLGKRLVQYWEGSDVLYAQQVAARGALSPLLRDTCIHWAMTDWLAAEVAEIGVKAKVVPWPVLYMPQQTLPLPQEFTVLAYLPTGKADFYGGNEVLRLASDLPEVKFLVVGSDRLAAAPPNVELLGWVQDMEPVYAQATVVVRYPEHDALARMVLEALAYGRYVVWTYELANVLVAASYDELRNHVEALLQRHRRGTLGVNEEGAQYVWREFEPQAVMRRFTAELAGALRG